MKSTSKKKLLVSALIVVLFGLSGCNEEDPSASADNPVPNVGPSTSQGIQIGQINSKNEVAILIPLSSFGPDMNSAGGATIQISINGVVKYKSIDANKHYNRSDKTVRFTLLGLNDQDLLTFVLTDDLVNVFEGRVSDSRSTVATLSPLNSDNNGSLKGELDTDFGNGGYVYLTPLQHEAAINGAVDSQGRILLHAMSTDEPIDLSRMNYLTRLTPLGQIDLKFGKSGFIYMPVASDFIGVEPDDSLMTIQGLLSTNYQYGADDQSQPEKPTQPDRFALNKSGQIVDPKTHDGVLYATRHFASISLLANTNEYVLDGVGRYEVYGKDGIARFLSDSPRTKERFDTAYGENGIAPFNADLFLKWYLRWFSIANFALDQDKRVTIAIRSFPTTGEKYLNVFRLLENGDTDPNFGNAGDGMLVIDPAHFKFLVGTIEVSSIILDENNGFWVYAFTDEAGLVFHLNDDGSLDTSFAKNGVFKFPFKKGLLHGGSSMFFDNEGRLMILGTQYQDPPWSDSNLNVFLMRIK